MGGMKRLLEEEQINSPQESGGCLLQLTENKVNQKPQTYGEKYKSLFERAELIRRRQV